MCFLTKLSVVYVNKKSDEIGVGCTNSLRGSKPNSRTFFSYEWLLSKVTLHLFWDIFYS